MADVVNVTSKDNGSNDGNGKGEIGSTTNKVIDLWMMMMLMEREALFES